MLIEMVKSKLAGLELLSLSLKEFDKLVTLIPQVQDSIATFEL